MKRSIRLDLVFTLEGPLHHGSGTDGNLAVFRQEKSVVVDPDGSVRVQALPILSGNSLKHTVIRDPGVRHMLAVLGAEGLSKPAIHLLFSGGALTKKGSAINAEQYRELCSLIPLLGLLGGAIGNSMRQSKLSVSDALPVCDEHRDRIPVLELGLDDGERPAILSTELANLPIAEMMDTRLLTRHDPLRDPYVRDLLPAADRHLLDGAQSDALALREEGQHVDKGDSQQMIAETQVIARGAQLHASLHTHHLTPLEEAALWCAIGAWRTAPFLGAGRARGLGRASLRIRASEPIAVPDVEWRSVPVPAGMHGEAAAAAAMVVDYEEHIRTHRESILRALGGID